MWTPSTWAELQELVGEPERDNLDFKRELASDGKTKLKANQDLASDVAAMSIDGGLILIGVEEDTNSCASGLPGVPLGGFSERVSQVCGTRINPPLAPLVSEIADPERPGYGVVAVRVEPSRQAPHYTGNRFPARSERTTTYLTEPQIERLYGRRSTSGHIKSPMRLLEPRNLRTPSYFEAGGRNDSTAAATLAIGPAYPAAHPRSPHLGLALSEARADAGARLQTNQWLAGAMRQLGLRDWEPLGVDGWTAKQYKPPVSGLLRLSASYYYAGAFMRFGLGAETRMSAFEKQGYGSAREDMLLPLLVAQLAVAGAFFSQVPAIGPLAVALKLRHSTFGPTTDQGGRPALPTYAHRHISHSYSVPPDDLRAAPLEYVAEAIVEAQDLCCTPTTTLIQLTDRWLLAIDAHDEQQWLDLRVSGAGPGGHS